MKKIISLLFLSCILLQTVLFTSCSDNKQTVITPTATATEPRTDYKDENGVGYTILEDDTLKVSLSNNKSEVTIPEEYEGKKVTVIGRSAFKMSDVVKVTLPDTITAIEDFAFAFSPKLESINIPEGVVSIGTNAFSGCLALKTVKLPKSLKKIDIYTFDGCGLTEIEIPKNIETIDQYAFAECLDLEKVVIKGNNLFIADNAFNRSNKVIIHASKKSSAISYAKSRGITYKKN